MAEEDRLVLQSNGLRLCKWTGRLICTFSTGAGKGCCDCVRVERKAVWTHITKFHEGDKHLSNKLFRAAERLSQENKECSELKIKYEQGGASHGALPLIEGLSVYMGKKCPFCEVIFISDETLRKHVRNVHKSKLSLDEIRSLPSINCQSLSKKNAKGRWFATIGRCVSNEKMYDPGHADPQTVNEKREELKSAFVYRSKCDERLSDCDLTLEQAILLTESGSKWTNSELEDRIQKAGAVLVGQFKEAGDLARKAKILKNVLVIIATSGAFKKGTPFEFLRIADSEEARGTAARYSRSVLIIVRVVCLLVRKSKELPAVALSDDMRKRVEDFLACEPDAGREKFQDALFFLLWAIFNEKVTYNEAAAPTLAYIVGACLCTTADGGGRARFASGRNVSSKISGILHCVSCYYALHVFKYTEESGRDKALDKVEGLSDPRARVGSHVFTDLRSICASVRDQEGKLTVYRHCSVHKMCGFVDGQELSALQIGCAVKKIHQNVRRKMFEGLFAGVQLPTNFRRKVDTMTDDLDNDCVGYWALADERNVQFVGECVKWSHDIALNDGYVRKGGWQRWRRTSEDLLKDILLAMHLCGGGPSRGTEIGALTIRNTRTARRTVFFVGDEVMLVPIHSKTRSMKRGLKMLFITRHLDRETSFLFRAFFLLIHPVLVMEGEHSRAQGAKEWCNVLRLRDNLTLGLIENAKVASVIGSKMSEYSIPFKFSQYRHLQRGMVKAMARESAIDKEAKMWRGFADEQKKEGDEEEGQATMEQAGHTTHTAIVHYAHSCRVDGVVLHAEMKRIELFRSVSRAWHKHLGLTRNIECKKNNALVKSSGRESEILQGSGENDRLMRLVTSAVSMAIENIPETSAHCETKTVLGKNKRCGPHVAAGCTQTELYNERKKSSSERELTLAHARKSKLSLDSGGQSSSQSKTFEPEVPLSPVCKALDIDECDIAAPKHVFLDSVEYSQTLEKKLTNDTNKSNVPSLQVQNLEVTVVSRDLISGKDSLESVSNPVLSLGTDLISKKTINLNVPVPKPPSKMKDVEKTRNTVLKENCIAPVQRSIAKTLGASGNCARVGQYQKMAVLKEVGGNENGCNVRDPWAEFRSARVGDRRGRHSSSSLESRYMKSNEPKTKKRVVSKAGTPNKCLVSLKSQSYKNAERKRLRKSPKAEQNSRQVKKTAATCAKNLEHSKVMPEFRSVKGAEVTDMSVRGCDIDIDQMMSDIYDERVSDLSKNESEQISKCNVNPSYGASTRLSDLVCQDTQTVGRTENSTMGVSSPYGPRAVGFAGRTALETVTGKRGARFKSQAQEAAMDAVFRRRSDLAVVLRTGEGKTAVVMGPVRFEDGVTVWVAPLRALLWETEKRLSAAGIRAHRIDTFPVDERGRGRVLLVSPEDIGRGKYCGIIKSLAERNSLNRVVVDEARLAVTADCYRPCFSQLKMASMLGTVCPVVLLSATIPSQMLKGVAEACGAGYQGLEIIRGDPCRANLGISVISLKDGTSDTLSNEVLRYLSNTGGAGRCLVVCLTIDDARTLRDEIVYTGQWSEDKAQLYHSKLSAFDREKTLSVWNAHEGNSLMVMVATEGFCTGTDAPDVRHVVFAGGARNILDFWQGAGRAGRDGMPADVVVLYHKLHLLRAGENEVAPNTVNAGGMGDFSRWAEDTGQCRRISIESCLSTPSALQKSCCQRSNVRLCDTCRKLSNNLHEVSQIKNCEVENWRRRVPQELVVLDDLQQRHNKLSSIHGRVRWLRELSRALRSVDLLNALNSFKSNLHGRVVVFSRQRTFSPKRHKRTVLRCNRCHQEGHFARECPNIDSVQDCGVRRCRYCFLISVGGADVHKGGDFGNPSCPLVCCTQLLLLAWSFTNIKEAMLSKTKGLFCGNDGTRPKSDRDFANWVIQEGSRKEAGIITGLEWLSERINLPRI